MSAEENTFVPQPLAVAATLPEAVTAGAAAGTGAAGGSAAVLTDRRSRLGIRAWVLTGFLLLAPILVFWPAIFHDYGLRDDYSNLREAHEEPGKILMFCASHARPIYGLLLQASYGQTTSVENLEWLRLLSALLLGAIALVSFRGLRSLGWHFNPALCFALLVGLVPSAQVIAGWAVGWPYAATALLALGGFFMADGALAGGSMSQRSLIQWGVALGLMVASALMYQPSALFYVVPLAGALIAQRRRGAVPTARWALAHLAFVTISLALAYGIMSVLYATHVFVKSGRVAFETHWLDKFAWFLAEPLPNALSFFVLNDDHHRDHGLYLAGATLAGLILAAGAVLEWRRYGWARGLVWLAGLVGLPTFAFGVSLLASERYATYRTIFALTAVLLCFLVASARMLTEYLGASARRTIAAVVFAAAVLSAQHHCFALLAVPQGNEWDLIVAGARRLHMGEPHPRVFAIASTPADISTATIYHDEFGSLSSNSEWVPKEMFKRAMHDLHPDKPNIDARYEFDTGPKLPVGKRFDVIIDLHRLHRFYTNN
jgi:hypothetical protein